jgi:regulator of cell morphogenesis and NO signaling
MYQTNKLYVTPLLSMTELVTENPSILIMLEHFEADCVLHDDTVSGFCKRHNISLQVFILVANLYNGITPSSIPELTHADIMALIRFLANSHVYYKTQKYPEIELYISQLSEYNKAPEIPLVTKFFDEYFTEVIEHLEYENSVAFPFFISLLNKQQVITKVGEFSSQEYKEHHTDIESSLSELKRLLLKHVPIQKDRVLRRKILMSLFELEYDLHKHSLIEEVILTPLMQDIEKNQYNVKK